MNEPMPGTRPGEHPEPVGHRPLPGPPSHGQVRRPLAAPGGTRPAAAGPRAPEPPAPGPHAAGVRPVVPAASPQDTEVPRQDVAADAPEAPTDTDDDGTRPLGLRPEPTGHPPVDDRLRRLEEADHLAVSGHLEVYEDVHRGLRDTLTALDRHDPRS